MNIDGPFTYLIALRCVLFTMALAGSYCVAGWSERGPNEKQLFAPLDPLLQHLARAESAVLKYTQESHRFADAQVLAKLRTIAENVRSEWARLTRNSGESLGEAVVSSHTYVASLWMTEPTRPAAALDRGDKGGGKGRPGSDDRGRGNREQGKDRATKDREHEGPARSRAVSETCRAESNGKKLCKPWNDARGCNNSKCPDVHLCDIMLPLGKLCLQKHQRGGPQGSFSAHLTNRAPGYARAARESPRIDASGTRGRDS